MENMGEKEKAILYALCKFFKGNGISNETDILLWMDNVSALVEIRLAKQKKQKEREDRRRAKPRHIVQYDSDF